MTGAWHSVVVTRPLSLCRLDMALETEHEAVKIQELEDQVAALKKENTRLKNEMRFNMDQEK